MMDQLGLAHRQSFRRTYLNPALAAGLVEMTDPDSPRSPVQMYRLTERGHSMLKHP
ncbi:MULTISPECIES: Fic family protein [unclassified Pseudomonas]|uniref:Fic family protein n=1 Tax=unclassified Pseudomonas TaxID=196821 RepID=UPI00387E766E